MTTVFEQIIARTLPAEIVFENERIIAIEDRYPVAPVHLLIISKKVIPSLQALAPEDSPLVGEMMGVIQDLAAKFNVADHYRIVTNVGAQAGQSIPHLHWHLIGGRRLGRLG